MATLVRHFKAASSFQPGFTIRSITTAGVKWGGLTQLPCEASASSATGGPRANSSGGLIPCDYCASEFHPGDSKGPSMPSNPSLGTVGACDHPYPLCYTLHPWQCRSSYPVRSQRCWYQVWELHIYKDFEVTSPWSLQGACGL